MKSSGLQKYILVAAFLFFTCFGVLAQNKVQLEDIYRDYKFRIATVDEPVSMKDGKTYTLLVDNESIVKYDYASGNELGTIFSLNKTTIPGETEISGYSFSEKEDKILITGSQIPFYRHSFFAGYYVFDIKKEQLVPVTNKKLHMAKISPDGSHVAFVYNNNLFVKNLEKNQITQVTKDGLHASIINGMPDWLYEEEFSLKSGFEWSPDSRQIAFYRFDETHVKEYQLEYYSELYPDLYRYKYPKAGEENSKLTIHVFELKSGKTNTMDAGNETDIYIPRIKWTMDPEKLCIVRLNRLQNKAELLLAEASTGKTSILYTETDEKYISEFSDKFATFLPGNEVVIMSEKDGFQHLYRYNLKGELLNQITKGSWEVSDLLGIDTKNKLVYYTSTEISPLERHIYAIHLNGSGSRKLSTEKGVHEPVFSSTYDYYLDNYSSATHPSIVTVRTNAGEVLRTIEKNEQLEKLCQEFGFTEREFFSLKGPAGNELYGYMVKPADFDSAKKYPLLMYVYGGPGSQEVINNWERYTPWFQYLANQGYIVACVDNRGGDGRGVEFKKSTYLQLGKYETEDQVAAAHYLGSKVYINKERIGIFGWSYGGFMVLNCLMDKSQIFKIGIAVAPVTNWRFYDSAYTERFMRRPSDNASGYDENSPIFKAGGLHGKLLLIHGMADDNVHAQNSIMLINELVRQNKQFDLMFYPNSNHGIYGGNTRLHLFTKISEYIVKNL